jgi:hypothetical protein
MRNYELSDEAQRLYNKAKGDPDFSQVGANSAQ